jgi:hypothetical protein
MPPIIISVDSVPTLEKMLFHKGYILQSIDNIKFVNILVFWQ